MVKGTSNVVKPMNRQSLTPSLIPKLEPGQYSITFAEANTGILLTPDGERHVGQGPCYKLFNSESDAFAFAAAYVDQHPGIECSVRDESGKHLKFIRKNS